MTLRSMNVGWFLAFALGLGIVGLALLPPFVAESARTYIMQGFSVVCHQLPGRSPHLDGVQLAVCHRCFGIYAGLPLAAMAFLGVRRRINLGKRGPWVLALSLLPMILDWGGDVLGLFTNTAASRVATGLVFGLVAGLFLVLAFVDAVSSAPRAPDDAAQAAIPGAAPQASPADVESEPR